MVVRLVDAGAPIDAKTIETGSVLLFLLDSAVILLTTEYIALRRRFHGPR